MDTETLEKIAVKEGFSKFQFTNRDIITLQHWYLGYDAYIYRHNNIEVCRERCLELIG
jgi:hypothetical protein